MLIHRVLLDYFEIVSAHTCLLEVTVVILFCTIWIIYLIHIFVVLSGFVLMCKSLFVLFFHFLLHVKHFCVNLVGANIRVNSLALSWTF
jgi:hypothetical protein